MTHSKPKSTIAVTTRDRFSLAVQSLNEIVRVTEKPYDLVYIDAGSPKKIAKELHTICERNGFRYLRFDHFLSPCQARNIANREAKTRYIAYCENDVMVTEGWLRNLEACADETGAEVVQPLVCEGAPLHTKIHQAGNNFTDDMDAFFNGTPESRRLKDDYMGYQGKNVSDVELERTETQVTEVHALLVRRDAFQWLGEFDENMPCSKDHVDFSMNVWEKGGRIMLEPSSVVTFCVPSRAHPVKPVDYGMYLLRWSPKWQEQSLNHFRRKWDLENDPYFSHFLNLTTWRYAEGVGKPIVRRIPLIGRSYKVQKAGAALLTPLLKFVGARLVSQQARDFKKMAGAWSAKASGKPSELPDRQGTSDENLAA